jgi:hypothetical protein
MILDQTDTTCECHACAYQWERGQSGEHDCLSRVISQRDEAETKRKKLHEVLESVTDSLEILLEGREGFAPLLPVGSIPRGIVEGAFVGVQEKIQEAMR